MNRLFHVLFQSAHITVFLLLEAIAISMFVNSDSIQSTMISKQGLNLTTSVHRRLNYLLETFTLRTTNGKLNEENAQLMSDNIILREQLGLQKQYDLITSFKQEGSTPEGEKVLDPNELVQSLQQVNADQAPSFLEHQVPKTLAQIFVNSSESTQNIAKELNFIPAKIVQTHLDAFQNYIIIDKGEVDGILPDMGLICTDGVLGIVDHVSKHYAYILPLVNVKQPTSVRLLKSHQLGSLVWEGNNIYTSTLKEIPLHVNPQVGDSVVTSGFSAIFPQGMFVGTIKSVNLNQNQQFAGIKVSLAVDFTTITHVFVVKYNHQQELLKMEQSINS